MKSGIRCFFWSVALLFAWSGVSWAQNINGEKIQVATDALTVIRFNSEIKRYELGNRDGFTCQVRGNDNSIVIKTISNNPASTNLVVTEGKRTHYFIILFLKKVDINNTRLYYDFSDIKALKRLVNGGGEAMAAKEEHAGNGVQEEEKKSKKQVKKEEREQREKAKAEEEKKQQQLALEQEAARQKVRVKEEAARKVQQDKEDALAKERARREAQEKQRELAKAQQEEKEADRKRAKEEKERLAKINAIADARERQKQLEIQKAEAQARQEAQAKEKQRLKEEKARIAKEEQQALAARQAAKEAESRRLKEEKAKQDKIDAELAAEARKKNEYSMAGLFRKYPKIRFAEPPEGQRLTGEYYIPADTAINYATAMRVLGEKPRLRKLTVTSNGVTITLQSITFSAVNAYLSIRVENGSAKDFLVGNMFLKWMKSAGEEYNLWACYVTDYPVVPPGSGASLVYVARAVNAGDADRMIFSLGDRLTGSSFEIPFGGKVYNEEMNR